MKTLALPHPSFAPTRLLATWRTRYETLVAQLETGTRRLAMQSAMLMVQGNVIAPLSLVLFQYYETGYSDYFAGAVAVLFLAVLIANIAVLPVRVCLRVFALNLLLHAALIALNFAL